MERQMMSGWGRFMALMVSGILLAGLFGLQAAAASALEFEFKRAFGSDGSSSSSFAKAGSVAVDNEENSVYVLDIEAKTLFKFDLEGNPVPFGGSSPDISGNELSGLSVGGGLGERQVAVNQSTHTVYLTAGYDPLTEKAHSLQAFASNGEPATFLAGPGAGTNEIGGFPNLRGVAVDKNGAIYLSGTETDEFEAFANQVSVYSEAGTLLLGKVGSPMFSTANLAVDGRGTLYVLQELRNLTRLVPSEFPVTPTTTYTESPELVDPHNVITVSADALSNRLYAVETFPEESTTVARVAVFGEDGTLEGTFGGPGEPGELDHPSGIGVADVGEFGQDGDIAQPFVAHNPEGGLAQVEIFREEITVAAPNVEATTATSITGDSATLRAKINPNNRTTTYWFEYGLAPCSVVACTKVPLAAGSVGSGRRGVVVSEPIAGLDAGTTYNFRVVAVNEKGETEGPDKSFTTQSSELGFVLGDSRVWELVSPAAKFNGEVVTDDTAITQASASGEGVAFASLGSLFADPQGSRSPQPTTVLSRREGGGGWASQDLSPPHTEATLISGDSEFKIFSLGLLKAAMEPVDETPLSPEASEQTTYQWEEGAPPLFTPMVNPSNVPSGTVFGPKNAAAPGARLIHIEGTSPDLEHVAINSEVPLSEGAVGRAVYLWGEGELKTVSRLPQEEGGEVVLGILGSGQGSVRHAISDDGTRAVWAPTQAYGVAGIGLPALYLFDAATGESVRLDVQEEGVGGGTSANPAFNIASADGSDVFFTDSQRLTEDASSSGRDLYRCVVGPIEEGLGCSELTDISAPSEGSGENAETLDQVSGASEDGTSLYFVARGVLDEEPNGAGEVASVGEPNLYHWEQGQATRYVATLSSRDTFVWGSVPGNPGFAEQISAQASPDGRFFTFTSVRSLTGYENRNGSDQPTGEVFVYDASADSLACASCNPSGAAAVGERLIGKANFAPDPARVWKGKWMAATLPEPSKTEVGGRSLYHPRSILDNGRVFFNSVDPLVPADTNAKWDVYQYEPLGVGSCSAATGGSTVNRSGPGCVGLISSGTADGESGFLDGSSSGDDVFFVTIGRLSALDHDNEVDVYDARVGGRAATLPSSTECLAEACRAAVQAPSDTPPGSASFTGQGNVKAKAPKHCPKNKRKVKRHGKARCVSKAHKKKHQDSGRAGMNGGANR